MKTKIIAVLIALSGIVCSVSAQSNNTLRGPQNNSGSNSNNSTGTNTGNQQVNNTPATPKTQPQLDLSGKLLTENNLRYVYNEVAKTKEYQAFAKKVNTKVGNSKVGKKVNSFRAFLQRVGLAKKTSPAKKSSK